MKLVEILRHNNKIKTVDDLLINFDAIIELAKDDIQRISKSKKIYIADFDFAYKNAVQILKSQLKKKHLSSVRSFLEYKNIENAIKWFIQRLLNNMRNITTNKKYKLFFTANFTKLHENIEIEYDYEKTLEKLDLQKMNRNIIKNGLKRVWNESKFDNDFDLDDMKYLCEKFGFVIDDIVVKNMLNTLNFKKEQQVESGNSQLVFVFE